MMARAHVRRGSLALVLTLLAGCSAAHTSDGDAAVLDADASDVVDAPALDGADSADASIPLDGPCPDADGDGARDARCGGNDCDDADPHVGPNAGVCTGPTRVRECDGAMVSEHDCSGLTPDCDGRVGHCAARACGDGVLQPDEQCDVPGGVPCVSCSVCCRNDADCTPLGMDPVCVPNPSRPAASCGRCFNPTSIGAVQGTPCTMNSQCGSFYCDPEQSRCSSVCSNYPGECATPAGSWCGRAENAVFGPGTEPFTHYTVCHFPCASDADCSRATRCTTVEVPRETGTMELASTCRYPPTGGLPFGAACSDITPTCDSNNCIGGVCTRTCLGDSDCSAPLPHCVPFTMTVFGSVPGPLTPSVCAS